MFLRLAEHILVLLIRVLGDLSLETVSTFDLTFFVPEMVNLNAAERPRS